MVKSCLKEKIPKYRTNMPEHYLLIPFIIIDIGAILKRGMRNLLHPKFNWNVTYALCTSMIKQYAKFQTWNINSMTMPRTICNNTSMYCVHKVIGNAGNSVSVLRMCAIHILPREKTREENVIFCELYFKNVNQCYKQNKLYLKVHV